MAVASTISRERFLELMTEKAGPEAAPFTEQILARKGWQAKTTFTQADVVEFAAGITSYAREAMVGPAAPAAMDDATRAHVGALLDMLDEHALPVLRATAEV